MRTALVILFASLGMLIAGCGAMIRPDGAAQSVVDLVKEQTGFEAKDVQCPDDVDAKEGTEFKCKFTGPEGDEYTADMKVTKVEGENVEFYIQTRPSKG